MIWSKHRKQLYVQAETLASISELARLRIRFLMLSCNLVLSIKLAQRKANLDKTLNLDQS